MPRGYITVQWRERYNRSLTNYTDFLRNEERPLVCSVSGVDPPLRLPWNYGENVVGTWECTEVWLHDASRANGTPVLGSTCILLEKAVNHIAANKNDARYSLLVCQDGMFYDRNRYGGDHQVKVEDRRVFTFSVRKHPTRNGSMILLAVYWGQLPM